MRRIFFLIVVACILVMACNNSTKQVDQETTETPEDRGGTTTMGEVSIEDPVYDFGIVDEGDIVEHVFKFTNSGSEPVIVSRVTASCGCTTPKYTTTPVAPGKEGEISVRFDSNGQVGAQQKIITVASNGQNSIQTIQIKGEVK